MAPVRARISVLLAAALLLIGAPCGRATTVLRQSLASLTSLSEVVVRGVVEDVAGHVEAPGHPYRLARVRVEETLRGAAPAVVHVRLPGGADDRGHDWAVAGTPDLSPGEEVVLFLERVPAAVTARPAVAPDHVYGRAGFHAAPASSAPPRDQWIPLALSLGAYHVVGAGAAAEARQDGSSSGVGLTGQPQGGPDAPARLPLADLVSAVRAFKAASPAPGGAHP